MSSLYMSPVQVLNSKVTGLASTVEAIQDSLKQVRSSCGLDKEEGSEHDDMLRIRTLIDEACTALRTTFKEDLRKERQLLDVAMTHKCEHAITQMIRDKFELLSKRCDILAEATSSIPHHISTNSSTITAGTETTLSGHSLDDIAEQVKQVQTEMAQLKEHVTNVNESDNDDEDDDDVRPKDLKSDLVSLREELRSFMASQIDRNKREEKERNHILQSVERRWKHDDASREKERLRSYQESVARSRIVDERINALCSSLNQFERKHAAASTHRQDNADIIDEEPHPSACDYDDGRKQEQPQEPEKEQDPEPEKKQGPEPEQRKDDDDVQDASSAPAPPSPAPVTTAPVTTAPDDAAAPATTTRKGNNGGGAKKGTKTIKSRKNNTLRL